jgi:hypothetical protein
MAVISLPLAPEAIHYISRRSNWAGHEAGVIVVFCVVFIVVTGVLGVFIGRAISRRKINRSVV